jgi:hypothetical protein
VFFAPAEGNQNQFVTLGRFLRLYK